MGLFSKKNKPETLTEKFIIWESFGPVTIDREYRDIGVSGGWLTLTNMHRDAYGVIVYAYSLTHPP